MNAPLRTAETSPPPVVRVNTSNKLKLAEFRRLLHPAPVEALSLDLSEPDTDDPVTIVQYKASQFPASAPVLVDDTSLNLPSHHHLTLGTNIKWLLSSLPTIPHNTPAEFVCLLGLRRGNQILFYRGVVKGRIVQPPRGRHYGFLAYFEPDGRSKTLGEEIVDEANARFYAVRDFLDGKVHCVREVMETWDGPFQGS
ncbi:hypothetical protein HK104_009062 [Borealophlyctis nickersoniae]|nr:hypothetical protein HK104_009062 [Borealophlyctis nickersoniae]